MTAAVPARQMQLSQWHRHTYAEFELKDADAALETMTDNPHVFCVPSGRGGTGKEGVRRFYANQFLSSIPPDLELLSISEIFAETHVVAEYVMRFTHSLQMDWMLPGVPPTGRRAELLLVTVIRFRERQDCKRACLLGRGGSPFSASPYQQWRRRSRNWKRSKAVKTRSTTRAPG